MTVAETLPRPEATLVPTRNADGAPRFSTTLPRGHNHPADPHHHREHASAGEGYTPGKKAQVKDEQQHETGNERQHAANQGQSPGAEQLGIRWERSAWSATILLR